MEAEDDDVRPVAESVSSHAQERLVLAIPHHAQVQDLGVREGRLHHRRKRLVVVRTLAERERVPHDDDPCGVGALDRILARPPHVGRVGADFRARVLVAREARGGDEAEVRVELYELAGVQALPFAMPALLPPSVRGNEVRQRQQLESRGGFADQEGEQRGDE